MLERGVASTSLATMSDLRNQTGISAAPNYTNAFLVSGGVVVFMFLFVLWAIWGLIVTAGLSWGVNRLFLTRN